ncbi:MAG: hypothetical protein LUG99_15030 [Lachnospiraceae bacterium]|nr:hypothetical protein [Lachnospiraceae bacterium]
MNKLSDYIVLDFCEYLSHKILNRRNCSEMDLGDLLFDEKFDYKLRKAAEDFCRINAQESEKDKIRKAVELFFRMFLESEEFESICNGFSNRKFCDDYSEFCIELKHVMYRFFKNMFEKEGIPNSSCWFVKNKSIYSEQLIYNARIVYHDCIANKESSPFVLYYMEFAKPVEVDFLEWLANDYDEKHILKLGTMPMDIFEDLVDNFQKETGRSNRDVKKLVHEFKSSDTHGIRYKLSKLLPEDNKYRKKDMQYIFDRYMNPDIPYKCIVLPIQTDIEEYGRLIEDYWYDLNEMSGDYLDIYYANAEYGQSGYKIMKDLNCLPEKMNGKLPCILIWQQEMKDGKTIDISRLGAEGIFNTFSAVVQGIQDKMELDQIIVKVEKMRNDQLNQNQTTHNEFYNYGTMRDAVVGDHSAIMVIEDKTEFFSEAQEAKKMISQSNEITVEQRQELLEIIDIAVNGIRDDSAEAQEISKARFGTVIKCCGKTMVKLLGALSSLTSIAGFFGLSSTLVNMWVYR